MQLKLSRPKIERLKALVKKYEHSNTPSEKKNARRNMQKLGFKMTDFGIRGITSVDLERLLEQNRVFAFEEESVQTQPMSIAQSSDNEIVAMTVGPDVSDIFSDLINSNFLHIVDDQINELVEYGFYCLRLKSEGNLPRPFQQILEQRSHRIVYFGKAEGQTLRERIFQELYGRGHGTFFRSIGAMLGFTPEPGSLIDKSNQYNYVFNLIDKQAIINWIESNLEIYIIDYRGDFRIEKKIISKLCPLLNITHNPSALLELSQLVSRCRQTARKR